MSQRHQFLARLGEPFWNEEVMHPEIKNSFLFSLAVRARSWSMYDAGGDAPRSRLSTWSGQCHPRHARVGRFHLRSSWHQGDLLRWIRYCSEFTLFQLSQYFWQISTLNLKKSTLIYRGNTSMKEEPRTANGCRAIWAPKITESSSLMPTSPTLWTN